MRRLKKFEMVILSILVLVLGGGAYLFADGTMNQLRPVVVQDMGGPPMAGIRSPGWVDAIVLVQNTAGSHTKPTGAKYVNFSGNVNFYVSYIGTASIPSVHTTTGLACELNPTLRDVTDVTAFSLISASSGIVTMGFFK